MVDIFLDLPDDLILRYERRGAALGRSAEALMREAIEGAVPAREGDAPIDHDAIADEPIVKAAEIENESRRLGYQLGWRFITCPQEWASTARVLLVTLNPAGTERHGPSWSQQDGSAYRMEKWPGFGRGLAPLQKQVQALLALLNLRDEEVFSANYVPFRSPSWAELAHRAAAERYADRLWKWLLPQVAFERIVCIGKDRPGRSMARLTEATFEVGLPLAWGSVSADRYRLPDGRPLLALPHLSRFRLFGRADSERALAAAFEV